MSAQLTLATAVRVLRQVRHDPRIVGLLIVIPCALIGLLAWVFSGGVVFDRIGAPLLGVFPFVVMFLVTSVATLGERQSGTLEELGDVGLQRHEIRRILRVPADRDGAGARSRPARRRSPRRWR